MEDQIVASEWHALDGDEEAEGEAAIRIVASAMEVLRDKSFADLTEDERRRMAKLIRRLAVRVPVRKTRRFRSAPAGPGSTCGGRSAARSARRVNRSTERGARGGAVTGRSC